MLTKNVNTSLVLSMSYLLHTTQELFCDDPVKREQLLQDFRVYRLQLFKGFSHILKQAEKFHRSQLACKGGDTDGNSSAVSVET